jgi:hypothetical protein
MSKVTEEKFREILSTILRDDTGLESGECGAITGTIVNHPEIKSLFEGNRIQDLLEAQDVVRYFNRLDTDDFITKYEIFKGDICPDEIKEEFKFCGLNNTDFMRTWPTEATKESESSCKEIVDNLEPEYNDGDRCPHHGMTFVGSKYCTEYCDDSECSHKRNEGEV